MFEKFSQFQRFGKNDNSKTSAPISINFFFGALNITMLNKHGILVRWKLGEHVRRRIEMANFEHLFGGNISGNCYKVTFSNKSILKKDVIGF